MNYLADKIREPWDLMRILRMGFGGYVLVSNILQTQYLLAFLGGMFVFQAITNTGCFGGSCATVSPSKSQTETEEVEFEVLSPKQDIES